MSDKVKIFDNKIIETENDKILQNEIDSCRFYDFANVDGFGECLRSL